MSPVKASSKREYSDLSLRQDTPTTIFRNFTLSAPTHVEMSVYQSGHKFAVTPGWHTKLAVYDHYIFHYILDGQGIYYAPNKTYEVKKGDIFLIFPNESVHYESDTLFPWTYYWIGFNGTDVLKILNLCGFSAGKLCASFAGEPALDKLFRQAAYPQYEGAAREYELLGVLYQIFSTLINMSIRPSVSQTEMYLNRAIEYIQHSYPSADMKVADVANFVGIDRTYLYRIFTETLHCSVQDYILSFRLKRACSLLTYSTSPVGVIAYSCGFDSPAYFSSVFKSKFQMTPLQYKKKFAARAERRGITPKNEG